MEKCNLIALIIDIINVLIVCGFVVETYVGFEEARTVKKFVLYGLAVIVGMTAFIYNVGRVVIVWLY